MCNRGLENCYESGIFEQSKTPMTYNFLSYKQKTMIVSSIPDVAIKQELLEKLAAELDDTGIVNVQSTTDTFNFTAPPFRWAWNGFHLFRFVSKAEIEFDKPKHVLFINFHLYFYELILITLALSLLAIPAYFAENYLWMAGILAGTWLGMYAGGIALSVFQLNRWIEKRVRRTEKVLTEETGDLSNYDIAKHLKTK